MLHNTALIGEAYTAASNFYTRWYDPTLGVVYNRDHTQRDYETDYTIDRGAALIDDKGNTTGIRYRSSCSARSNRSRASRNVDKNNPNTIMHTEDTYRKVVTALFHVHEEGDSYVS